MRSVVWCVNGEDGCVWSVVWCVNGEDGCVWSVVWCVMVQNYVCVYVYAEWYCNQKDKGHVTCHMCIM